MKIASIFGLAGLMLLVGANQPVLATSHGQSAGEYLVEFVEACTGGSNISESICECMGEAALDEEEYDDEQRDFLILMLSQSDDAPAAAQAMTPIKALGASMFMVNVPASCVG